MQPETIRRVRRFDAAAQEFPAAFTAFLQEGREAGFAMEESVGAIIAAVRTMGDAALLDYTKRFDRFDLSLDRLRIGSDAVDAAVRSVAPETMAALRLAAARIQAYHERQVPSDASWTDAAGIRLGWRWTALQSVGLYVPGGTASYPSSVLMNAIPAKVAGVDRLVMVVPTPDDIVNPLVLAAADLAGVDEIYRIGGAQAVAALAYGTASIGRVDKIVGPGNAYVAAAKRQVFGTVGIDTIAGPSEILVLADRANNPSWIAADLLSQAEHDTDAQSILITDDADFADAVEAAVDDHLSRLPRQAIAAASWLRFGAIILVPRLEDAVPIIDQVAPEHLELAIDEADAVAAKVRHAGAIFLGRYTPEAVGDYVGGPNHVLPTARAARFSSGLGVGDFMKRTTLLGTDLAGLRMIGPAGITLAKVEGLDAHALSIALRLD